MFRHFFFRLFFRATVGSVACVLRCFCPRNCARQILLCDVYFLCDTGSLVLRVFAFGILAWLLLIATLKSCDLAAFGVCDAVALGVLGSSASLCFRCTGPVRCLYFHSKKKFICIRISIHIYVSIHL